MKRILIVLALLCLPHAALAQCDPLPDMDLSIAMFRDTAYHEYPLSLMMVPDGSGDLFEEARRPDGTMVNGQIEVWLLDGMAFGHEGMPPAYVRLDAPAVGLKFCPEGNIAGQATDPDGYTYFSAPLYGGGWSQDGLIVRVCNTPLSMPALPLWVNSPDIDGDLEVTLSDVQLFAEDFYSATYQYRSDLAYDGVINLSDVARLALHIGAGCN